MQTIDREELKRRLDENQDFVFLNVLPEQSFQAAHIPGSQNIPLETENFEQKVEDLAGSKDKEIVVYCASVDCPASKNAAQKLDAAGFTNVQAYEGGVKDWKEAGYSVESA